MARLGKKNLAVVLLLATIAMGFGFLCLHGYEYYNEFLEGALPGKYYHFEEVTATGAPMFYTVYFLMTGLHSVHVLIGAGVLSVITYFTCARRLRCVVRPSDRSRRPLLALGRLDLDLPVPASVPGVRRTHGQPDTQSKDDHGHGGHAHSARMYCDHATPCSWPARS